MAKPVLNATLPPDEQACSAQTKCVEQPAADGLAPSRATAAGDERPPEGEVEVQGQGKQHDRKGSNAKPQNRCPICGKVGPWKWDC